MSKHLISAGKAAKLAGVSPGTISKALSSGRLSYVEKTENGYRIDPAEVTRVFPPKGGVGKVQADLERGQHNGNEGAETLALHIELAQTKARLEMLEAERDRERSESSKLVEDLRSRLDASETERRDLSKRLLTDQRETPIAEPHKAADGFWQRLGRVVTGKA